MKTYTAVEIDQARTSFRTRGYNEIQANVGGYDFGYFVLPQILEPRLSNFAFRCTGNLSKN